jgi:hypothetical protein
MNLQSLVFASIIAGNGTPHPFRRSSKANGTAIQEGAPHDPAGRQDRDD